MKKLFGTDGIRAAAGEFPLDPASILALGRALAELLRGEGLAPEVLVGKDTRESGDWIESAFAAGLRRAGGRVHPAGVIPTSGVAFLTRANGFAAGAVISASHNPYRDNGIKIFSAAGTKISDAWEKRLEESILRTRGESGAPGPGAEPLVPEPRFLLDYERFLTGLLGAGRTRRPLRIVLDCSNGAASAIAPEVYRAIGAEVLAIHCAPDGRNINRDCGSLHPAGLAEAVLGVGADLGVAFDGDADRALWVDEKGRILNGDHTLFILAGFMKGRGRLKSGSVVATTMSNMGLEKGLAGMGLELLRTRVGDKYVLEKMIERGANLGGERSGHTILLDDCPTGDGLLTSLRLVEVLDGTGAPLSVLAEGLAEFPQILLNVPVGRKPDFAEVPAVQAAVEEARASLAGRGRLDVRYSGTEPLVRVMVEGESAGEIEALARSVAAAVAAHLR
jgi:phosphoglucosamine mutase